MNMTLKCSSIASSTWRYASILIGIVVFGLCTTNTVHASTRSAPGSLPTLGTGIDPGVLDSWPLAESLQAPPVVGPTQALGAEYADADLATGGVTRFELQTDGGAFVAVGIPPKANDALTPAGMSTYRIAFPALTTGPHTLSVRACNVTTCGTAISITFQFGVTPAPFQGLRIIGGH